MTVHANQSYTFTLIRDGPPEPVTTYFREDGDLYAVFNRSNNAAFLVDANGAVVQTGVRYFSPADYSLRLGSSPFVNTATFTVAVKRD